MSRNSYEYAGVLIRQAYLHLLRDQPILDLNRPFGVKAIPLGSVGARRFADIEAGCVFA